LHRLLQQLAHCQRLARGPLFRNDDFDIHGACSGWLLNGGTPLPASSRQRKDLA
jgi:hypothetical protein